MPKKSLTSISICYVQEKNPFIFFIKFIFFKHFIGFFPQRMYIFLMCQFKCISGKNILSIFTFVKTLNHSPAQNLSNKKNRSFLRLLWADLLLRQFTKFWHTRAILCAPTVRVSFLQVQGIGTWLKRYGYSIKGTWSCAWRSISSSRAWSCCSAATWWQHIQIHSCWLVFF